MALSHLLSQTSDGLPHPLPRSSIPTHLSLCKVPADPHVDIHKKNAPAGSHTADLLSPAPKAPGLPFFRAAPPALPDFDTGDFLPGRSEVRYAPHALSGQAEYHPENSPRCFFHNRIRRYLLPADTHILTGAPLPFSSPPSDTAAALLWSLPRIIRGSLLPDCPVSVFPPASACAVSSRLPAAYCQYSSWQCPSPHPSAPALSYPAD